MPNPIVARDLVGLAAEVPTADAESALLREGRALSFASQSKITLNPDRKGALIDTASTVDGVDKHQQTGAFLMPSAGSHTEKGIEHLSRDLVLKTEDGLPKVFITDVGINPQNRGHVVGSVISGELRDMKSPAVNTNLCDGQFDDLGRLRVLSCTGEADKIIDGKEIHARTKSQTTLTYGDNERYSLPMQETATSYFSDSGSALGTIIQKIAFTAQGADVSVNVSH